MKSFICRILSNNSHYTAISSKHTKTAIIIIYSLVVLLYTYFSSTHKGHIESAVLFFIVPLLLIKFLFKEDLSKYGVTTINWKFAITSTLILVLLSIITTYFTSQLFPEIRNYYSVNSIDLRLILEIIIYMIGWEFLFRGFLLFGLTKNINFLSANIIQTFLFFLAHAGKPQIEVASTILTGFIFGFIAYKSKSFWPMAIIHSAIMISIIIFSSVY